MSQQPQTNCIKDIVIVGGGSAGWMTAAALVKVMGVDNYAIKLIESEAIGTVSVGEATIPNIRAFNEMLGIDENDFLKYTQGTFKLGIEFVNWRKMDHQYMHPFGPYGANMNGVPFHHYWLKGESQGHHHDLLDYCLEGRAAKENKFTRPVNIANSPLATMNYAFHFDASRYANYLRIFAEKLGVVRIEGKVAKVQTHLENGFIESVTLENDDMITADLFIDCSGFNALLIEQTLHTGFDDWSHWLPCNSAVAQACESLDDLKPYTISSAQQSGWQWQIPLQHRVGNGHVYSNRHLSEDEAIQILQNNLPGEAIGEPKTLHWVNGKRKKSWHKNCVAIGLSAGFIEPLESTGLQLIQAAIMRLLSLFPDKYFRQADIDAFNYYSDIELKQIRDFIILHYKQTERTDSDFWNYCREMEIPDSLNDKIKLYQSNGRVFRNNNELFNELSWLSILSGQGISPQGYHPLVDNMPADFMYSQLEKMRLIIKDCCVQIPDHREYIIKHCASEN